MQSDDDTADRVNGDDDQMMVFHACSRPNLYHGSGLPIKCIESARRRAIATDFNVSEDLLARPLTVYTAHAANVRTVYNVPVGILEGYSTERWSICLMFDCCKS